MGIPEFLKSAIDSKLSSVRTQTLFSSSQKLSYRYRECKKNNEPFMACYEDYLAYLVTRFPATYGVLSKVFSQVKETIPEIKTLLDVGAGPGTGFWAAQELFRLQNATLIEKEAGLIQLGKSLSELSQIKTEWIQKDLEKESEFQKHDLVVLSYALGELSEQAIPFLLKNLWNATEKVFVLVEPGTPIGFKKILNARAELLSLGAFIMGPCPHAQRCPLSQSDWCHFGERIERSSLHRQAKEGDLNYEDEKFSYLIVSRASVAQQGARILRRPQKRSGHVEVTLCSEQGIENKIISRKQKHIYREARKLEWGSLLNLNK